MSSDSGSLLIFFLFILIVYFVYRKFNPPTNSNANYYPGSDQTNQSEMNNADLSKLYKIAFEIRGFFESTARPKDLLEFPEFMNGVSILEASDFDDDTLIEYYAGGNVVISCMALEALHQRSISQETVNKIVSSLSSLYLWPLFFALRTISQHSKEPVVGAVIGQAGEWWAQTHLLTQMTDTFIVERLEKNEKITFGNLLGTLDSDKLAWVQNFLNNLDQTKVKSLQKEISTSEEPEPDSDFLNAFGRVWSYGVPSDLVFEHESLISHTNRIINSVFKAPCRSAILVGEPGVGKKTILRNLNLQIKKLNWRIFEATAANVMAGQIYMGQLEERLYNLVKYLDIKNGIVWFVPNFHELLYAGRHANSPVGMLEMLLPSIEAGTIRIIGETQPASFLKMTNENKQINTLFEIIRVEPMGDKDTMTLAQQWSDNQLKTKNAAPVANTETLKEGLNLVKQFLGDQETPGNLLNLLKLTWRRLHIADTKIRSLRIDDLIVSLSQWTGLPQSIIDDRMDLNLTELQSHFQDRVLGQTEAVQSLIERVAMIKAGLTDPTRPAGVFLFVGPTGTGKTEIAKTLSEFLFGSPDRMIRLDMSEFQNQDSLTSILGDPYHKKDTSTLVSQIRKQPFSVVLLDEFEKAHQKVWDVFLQVFDDGRLTGHHGNTADFRHSIIILTSNLGAKLQTGESIGFTSSSSLFSRQSVEKAVGQTFRREFINRLDRVIIFHPLSRTVMREILNNELKRAFERRGLRTREWAIEWEDSAIDFLLERGFTEDLGARPLKRAIDRYLLTTLAMTIVNHQFPEGDQFLFIRSDGKNIEVEFIDPNGPPPETAPALYKIPEGIELPEKVNLKRVLLDSYGNRDEAEYLKQEYLTYSEMILSEDWEKTKQDYLDMTYSAGFWDSENRFSILGEIEYMDRIETALNTAGRLMDRLLGNQGKIRTTFSPKLVKQLAQQLYLVSEAHKTFKQKLPKDTFIKVEAQFKLHKDALAGIEFFEKIIHMYRSWVSKRRMRILVLKEIMDQEKREYQFLAAVSGFGSYSILCEEDGLHVLEIPKTQKTFNKYNVHVHINPQPENPAENRDVLLNQALHIFSKSTGGAARIVRHYRFVPSPLIRDIIRKWRTGRVENVMEGDFDLMG